ncbi:hypothetical protein SDC9_150299 [bioreactor metagenome]|uniref:Uncharacterized protein n=1 Tax=bioreactor metagenome TaxID=1076179 RepID=A0A645ENQ5_9ZZZZ
MTGFFEHAVQQILDVFPDSRAVGAHNHAAAHAGIIGEIRLSDDIGIPFGKVNIHWGDVFHQFLFIIRHFRFSSLKSHIPDYYTFWHSKKQAAHYRKPVFPRKTGFKRVPRFNYARVSSM